MVNSFADEVAGLARDLLLSLWAELGIEGAPRRHDWQALDVEPLIIFTALCADAALRSRTIDWCAINSRYLSPKRLHNFSWMLGSGQRQVFQRYADAIARGARATEQASAGNQRMRVSATPDLRRPSLIQLRLRALVGVCARAEVLKLLLAEPDDAKSAASLVGPTGYGKSGLAQALDMLTLAGIASANVEGRRLVYRLNRPGGLAEALSGLPALFPDWPALFRAVAAILTYARGSAGADEQARVKAANLAIEDMRDQLARMPSGAGPPGVTDSETAAAFERWARHFVAEQAGAQPAESGKREVVYTVHRLLLGGWIATVKEEGDQPRPLALSDDPELHPERRAHRRLKLDEIGAAAEVIESILYDIRARELQRSRGSLVPRDAVSNARLPEMSRDFASELLRPMHKGQAATFTEEFLQRWSSHRHGGFSAAG